MVTQSRAVYAAIADPTRRAILDVLRRGERSAGDIASLFPVSRPAVSRHIRVLRQAGLVRERAKSRSRLYSLDPAPLRDVERWIEHYKVYWASRLHGLKRVAESLAVSDARSAADSEANSEANSGANSGAHPEAKPDLAED